MMDGTTQWVLQQSALVIVLVGFGVFLWRYALPKVQEIQDKRDALLANQQTKYEAALEAQIQEGRERGKARDREFLEALERVSREHTQALAANTDTLNRHAHEVANLNGQVATLAAKVKPPRKRVTLRKKPAA